MANAANQKLRLLHLLRLLVQRSDEGAGLTTNQLLDELANVGIDTERKSLYRDFKAMGEFGLKVEQNPAHEWYLANRPFSQDELTMLVDAVQSTPFLTAAMSERLIGKLGAFASEEGRARLEARIELAKYVKMANEDVFWNIDAILEAIASRRLVAFKYFRYECEGGKLVRKVQRERLAIPLRLIYADEKYYLLTYNEYYDNMVPFRVDRMLDVTCSEVPVPRKSVIATWRLEDDVVLSFGVYGSDAMGAKVEPITLDMKREWLGVVVDKFGTDLALYELEDGLLRVYAKAPLTPQFYGWLFQLGDAVRLTSPAHAIEEYKGYCTEILGMYE